MTLPDARAVMADVHLHSIDYLDKAVNEFEAILAADPNNAAALRGLGYAALRKQDFPRAGDYFRKAVQADSKDPRVFYYSALLWDQENSLDHDSDALANARKNLEKSIALDPNFADAYALLAQAHMRAGQDALALASMQKALELSPRNEQYLFNFSQMYLAMGKVDQATQILTRLTKSANPEVAQRARDSLQQVGTMQVVLHAMSDHASPQLVARADSESGSAAAVPEPVVAADVQPLPATAPPKFLKGQLLSVDCSHAPVAVLTVVAGAKTFKLKVPDTKEVAVIGADNFSCDWSKKNVALNYQEAPSGEADVLSVEIQ
jgi:tetratricopeptide (TPR) repeat protein